MRHLNPNSWCKQSSVDPKLLQSLISVQSYNDYSLSKGAITLQQIFVDVLLTFTEATMD